MKIKFNDSFSFGACTSATQSEGNHIDFKTNWDILYKNSPELFFDNCGPQTSSNTFNEYKKDIELYKQIGFNSFKTSIQWSRIFPKKGIISQDGINFYHGYFKEITKNNIELIVGLSHFDLPDWVYNDGGFENYENCNYFLDFAKLVLEEFGQYISHLATFTEPIVPIQFGYLDYYHPPGMVDNKRAIKAAFGVILAHSKVSNYFFNEYINKSNIKFGVVVNISPVLPKDNITFSQEDKLVADKYNLIHNYSFLDAMANGVFSKELVDILKENDCFFEPKKADLELIKKNKLDFIGVNYYSPFRIEANNKAEAEANKNHILKKLGKPFAWDKARMNKSRGWEIYPNMMEEICLIIKNRYNNMPFYISENGMGVEKEDNYRENGMIQDDYRIAFIQEHLEVLHNAIEKHGVNCFGYHLWASIDCWSWCNAYKNRYGLIEYDLENKIKKLKKSGYWYMELCKSKSFEKMKKRAEEFIDC